MGGQPSRRTGLAAGAQWEAGGDPSSQPVSTGLGLLASRWPERWLCLGNRPGQGRGALCPSPFSTPTKPGAPSVRLPHSRTQNTVYSTLPGLGDPDRPRSPSRLLCLRLPCSPELAGSVNYTPPSSTPASQELLQTLGSCSLRGHQPSPAHQRL